MKDKLIDENFGKNLKIVRKKRNMKRDFIIKYISSGALSEFENGKADIPLSKFYFIINSMGLNFSEFTRLANDYKEENFQKSWLEATHLISLKDKVGLKRLYKEQEKIKHVHQYDKLKFLMFKNKISQTLKEFCLTNNDVAFIIEHLHSI